MKKATLACVAALTLTLAAYGQGTMLVESSLANNGVTDLTAGNYYAGPYGLQVWELSPEPTGSALTTLLNGINGLTGLQAYNAMVADGFKMVTEYDDQSMSSEGSIQLGQQTFFNLPVGNIVLGLVAWNTGTTFAALPATAHVGALAFPQYAVNSLIDSPFAETLSAGWNSVGEDLVMVPIPEPASLALLGLGVGVFLVPLWRRRQQRRPPPAQSP